MKKLIIGIALIVIAYYLARAAGIGLAGGKVDSIVIPLGEVKIQYKITGN